jgi:hypothetical protein
MIAQVGYSVARRLGGRVTLGASAPCMWRRGAWVSWLSLKTKVDGLSLVWPQNHWGSFLRFGFKTGGSGFPVWASKLAATVW